MRMTRLGGVVGLLLVTGVLAAGAYPVAVSPKVSTLGIGGDLTVNFGPYLNGRTGINYWRHTVNVTLDEAEVEGTLQWMTVPLLLDWHPMAGGFRISAGGMINNNRVKLSADPTEPIELQGYDYWIDDLDGTIEFSPFAPYLGIGFGNAVGADSRVHFSCDFGIMFQGSLKASATARSSLPPELQAQLDSDLQQEIDDFEDDASGYKYYPVISLGLSIAF